MKKIFLLVIIIILIAGAWCLFNRQTPTKTIVPSPLIGTEEQTPTEVITPGPLIETEARIIAEKSCIKGGEALGPGSYNENSKTWWFDANLNARPEGCNPACVVSEETKTAEINWRCTGLKEPVACTMDAKQCPDGSYVGRTGPNCEFICP